MTSRTRTSQQRNLLYPDDCRGATARYRIVLTIVTVLTTSGPALANLPAAPSTDRSVVSRPFQGLFETDGILADLLTPTESTSQRQAMTDQAEVALAAALSGEIQAGFSDDPAGAAVPGQSQQKSITWLPLLGQSLELLVFQHAVRAGFEENTWKKTVEGPFWSDYFQSVKNLCCWKDGDKWTTNWLFHPLLGSEAAFVFANNHHQSKVTPPGMTGEYWSAKGKQGIFAVVYSTYFEIGPVLSECAIGNIGYTGEGQTWHDIVITPAVGVMMSAGEDVLRAYVIDRIDRRNHFWGATAAIFLNPTRTFANLLAFKIPWADPEWLVLQREARAREAARADRAAPAATGVRVVPEPK